MRIRMDMYQLKFLFGKNFVNELNNGQIMIRDTNPKSGSGICFLLNPKDEELFLFEDKEQAEKMNIMWDGTPTFCLGDFWTSKKGNKMFTINPNGKYLFVKVTWGGSFNTSCGDLDKMLLNKTGVHYSKFTRSNGGGAGYSFFIVDRNFVQAVDFDIL